MRVTERERKRKMRKRSMCMGLWGVERETERQRQVRMREIIPGLIDTTELQSLGPKRVQSLKVLYV